MFTAVSTWRACKIVFLFFLFVISYMLSFGIIPSVLRIYGFCDDMYAHYSPQGPVLRSSAAQIFVVDLIVHVHGF